MSYTEVINFGNCFFIFTLQLVQKKKVKLIIKLADHVLDFDWVENQSLTQENQ